MKFVFTCPVPDGDEKENHSTYDKEYYRKVVLAGGGMVYDDIQVTGQSETILISNHHARTYKYFHALLLGKKLPSQSPKSRFYYYPSNITPLYLTLCNRSSLYFEEVD